MKVLFLAGMYPTPKYPQKGIFCHEQVKALKQLNIDVDVVVPMPFYDDEVKCKEWTFEGVNVRYFKFFKLPRAYDFHNTGKNLYRALKRKINFTKYDVIHADSALPTGYAAMSISKKFNVPYVVHVHGLDAFLGENYSKYKNCGKIILACQKAFEDASAVIGVSDKALQRVEKRVNLSNKRFVAYNGVDVERFVPIAHENSQTKFISVGNLIPLKGHDYTIRAVKVLVDKGYKNFHLDIVGRGYLDGELKTLVQELDLTDYVSFYGYIPYDKVRDMMQKSDAFILPSYYEALGCVYLEAMACGLPVVGCYENGIDEVYKDGIEGFLIENKNQEQLALAMEKLLDKSLCKTMGEKARRFVESKFTWLDSAKSVILGYLNCNKKT